MGMQPDFGQGLGMVRPTSLRLYTKLRTETPMPDPQGRPGYDRWTRAAFMPYNGLLYRTAPVRAVLGHGLRASRKPAHAHSPAA